MRYFFDPGFLETPVSQWVMGVPIFTGIDSTISPLMTRPRFVWIQDWYLKHQRGRLERGQKVPPKGQRRPNSPGYWECELTNRLDQPLYEGKIEWAGGALRQFGPFHSCQGRKYIIYVYWVGFKNQCIGLREICRKMEQQLFTGDIYGFLPIHWMKLDSLF